MNGDFTFGLQWVLGGKGKGKRGRGGGFNVFDEVMVWMCDDGYDSFFNQRLTLPRPRSDDET